MKWTESLQHCLVESDTTDFQAEFDEPSMSQFESSQMSFLDHPELFGGFDKYPQVLEQWLETHLMDVVNRGKPNQAIAAPRPLHGYTYRFRNAKKCRDYGAAQQIYETLYHARTGGQNAIDQLKRFFFPGHDLTLINLTEVRRSTSKRKLYWHFAIR